MDKVFNILVILVFSTVAEVQRHSKTYLPTIFLNLSQRNPSGTSRELSRRAAT